MKFVIYYPEGNRHIHDGIVVPAYPGTPNYGCLVRFVALDPLFK